MEIFHPDPAAMREDPDWPGEEVSRAARCPSSSAGPGGPGALRLVLSGHVDVVPPAIPRPGPGDAWSGDVRDGRLYGRGACDMKGGIAAILGAVRALGVTGALGSLQGELVVALVPSEEDGGQGTLARDPCRRDRRPVRDPGAVVASTSSSPTRAPSRSG